MNGEAGNGDKKSVVEEGVELDEASEDTVVMEDVADIDNVGDISVEIDVEELVSKIEAIEGDEGDEAEHMREVHRRLEKINDQREVDEELDDTYNFNIDDDL
jgi:hypothetical protein